MNEQIRLIADRIRGLRDIAKLSVETCAGDLGIPADTYRSYESGQADIPASFLYQVAQKFHVDLTSLLTGEEPRLHVYAVTRAGQGREGGAPQGLRLPEPRPQLHQPADGTLLYYGPFPAGLGSHPAERSSRPGVQLPPGRRSRVVVGGHEVQLTPGDSIYFDAMNPHGLKAQGGKPAKLLAVILYGGEGHASSIRGKDGVFLLRGFFKELPREVPDQFNFAWDVVDEIGRAEPEKQALVWCDENGAEATFGFADMAEMSTSAAVFFLTIGIAAGTPSC